MDKHLCLKVEPFAVTQKPHVILHGWLDVRKSAVCPGAKVYCTPSVVMVKRMLSTVNFHQFVLFFAGMVEGSSERRGISDPGVGLFTLSSLATVRWLGRRSAVPVT